MDAYAALGKNPGQDAKQKARGEGFAVDEAGDWSQVDVSMSVNDYDCLIL